MTETGIINIRGKEYQTVALRIKEFRKEYPEAGIRTAIVEMDEQRIVMRAEIYTGLEWLAATGHAEEFRASSNVNKTSALENCETSAIGRALAAFGLGGTEFASADEMQGTIETITDEQALELEAIAKEARGGLKALMSFLKGHKPPINTIEEIPASQYDRILNEVKKRLPE